MQKKFLKNNFIYLVSAGLGGVFGYLFHFVISRKISVAQYGELQAINSLMLISGVFFSAASYFIIKKSSVFAMHNDRRGQSSFLLFVMRKFRVLVWGFVGVFLLLLPVFKNILHLQNYWGILAIGLSMAILFQSAFYNNALQGWRNFLPMGLIGSLAIVIKLISGYALAIFSPTASSVAWAFLISAVFGWLILRTYFWKKWPMAEKEKNDMQWRSKYFNGVSFKKSLAQILFFSFGLAIISNVDIVIVKSLVSPQVAGYYGALSVLGKIILWLNFSIISVLFPEACSEGYSGKPASREAILGSYGLILLISLPILATYYFFSHFFVGVMFGTDYLVVASNLWLFGLMAFALSLLTLEAKLALARHEKRASLLLLAAVGLLGGGIFLFHANIHAIIVAVAASFFCGWLMLLALNFFHRVQYATAGK